MNLRTDLIEVNPWKHGWWDFLNALNSDLCEEGPWIDCCTLRKHELKNELMWVNLWNHCWWGESVPRKLNPLADTWALIGTIISLITPHVSPQGCANTLIRWRPSRVYRQPLISSSASSLPLPHLLHWKKRRKTLGKTLRNFFFFFLAFCTHLDSIFLC